MKLMRTAEELQGERSRLGDLGFVPTMGALHAGHGTLIRRSAVQHPHTLVSIFVNPTQFGPKEDFAAYPRTLEADMALAKEMGATHVFAPSAEEIYPKGWKTFVEVEGLTEKLCGPFRPGHFRGVATVVHRLFQLVKPQSAYFGQKDLQQCLVVQKMVEDLGLQVKVEVVPTVREQDGLAMSSRNRYLQAEDRARASVIFRALQRSLEDFSLGEVRVEALLEAARKILSEVPQLKTQYLEILSLPLLDSIEEIRGPAAIAFAGHLGSTRLIDNMIFPLE